MLKRTVRLMSVLIIATSLIGCSKPIYEVVGEKAREEIMEGLATGWEEGKEGEETDFCTDAWICEDETHLQHKGQRLRDHNLGKCVSSATFCEECKREETNE